MSWKFIFPLLFIVSDYIAVLCAEKLSFSLRNILMPNQKALNIAWYNFYIVIPGIYVFFMSLHELYNKKMQSWRIIESIFKANIYATVFCIFFLYVADLAKHTPRLFVCLLGILALVFIILFRIFIKASFGKNHRLHEPALLMGAGRTAAILLKFIKKDIGFNYHFLGYLEDNIAEQEVALQLPHLGGFADAVSVIKSTGVKNVIVAAPGLTQQKIQEIVYELQPLVNRISFIPDMGNMPLSNLDYESLIDGHVLLLRIRNNMRDKSNRLMKFTFDWCLALFITLFFIPVFLVISSWIIFETSGSAILEQRRIGKNGKEYNQYSFRTMFASMEEKLQKNNTDDLPLSKSGCFLCRTGLVKLPQLFNVLKGEMGLVGPKPIKPDEIPLYGRNINDYYMVRPGIIGIWNTEEFRNMSYEELIQIDSLYVRNWNIWYDIVLLWRWLVAHGKSNCNRD